MSSSTSSSEDERVSSRNITVDRLIAAAQRILHPYTLEVKEVAWWSVYDIGQRLCDKFDDVPDEEVANRAAPRFHSRRRLPYPQPEGRTGHERIHAGQLQSGLETGSRPTGSVRTPQFLHTYSAERQAIAKELIDFDREWAKMLSAPLKDATEPAKASIRPRCRDISSSTDATLRERRPSTGLRSSPPSRTISIWPKAW